MEGVIMSITPCSIMCGTGINSEDPFIFMGKPSFDSISVVLLNMIVKSQISHDLYFRYYNGSEYFMIFTISMEGPKAEFTSDLLDLMIKELKDFGEEFMSVKTVNALISNPMIKFRRVK
jgi:hypothetical protein